jgi:hypothetical protein
MRAATSMRCFDVSTATAAVRCFDMWRFDVSGSAATAAAMRTLEGLRLLRVLPLEGLHLLRVLTLQLLLLRKVLTLSRLLVGRLLARERLRFILMPAHQICSLLSVFIFDLPPISASIYRRGLLALLLLLQMLALESLRLRVMLLLKLPQLLDAIAIGLLLLLHAIALELLQLHVVLPL